MITNKPGSNFKGDFFFGVVFFTFALILAFFPILSHAPFSSWLFSNVSVVISFHSSYNLDTGTGMPSTEERIFV